MGFPTQTYRDGAGDCYIYTVLGCVTFFFVISERGPIGLFNWVWVMD